MNDCSPFGPRVRLCSKPNRTVVQVMYDGAWRDYSAYPHDDPDWPAKAQDDARHVRKLILENEDPFK